MVGCWRSLLLLPGTLLAFLAAGLGAPATAHASCGDYVVLGSPTTPTSAALPSHVIPPEKPAPPCHGPACSRGTLPPLLPPAVSVPTPEEWTLPAVERMAASPDPSGWCPEPAAQRPRKSSMSIFHPPR
jgi:hypothetical protein